MNFNKILYFLIIFFIFISLNILHSLEKDHFPFPEIYDSYTNYLQLSKDLKMATFDIDIDNNEKEILNHSSSYVARALHEIRPSRSVQSFKKLLTNATYRAILDETPKRSELFTKSAKAP